MKATLLFFLVLGLVLILVGERASDKPGDASKRQETNGQTSPRAVAMPDKPDASAIPARTLAPHERGEPTATPSVPSPPTLTPHGMDDYTVYKDLFSADPRERGGALDAIALRPDVFSGQNEVIARLTDMNADYAVEVAELASQVLNQLMAWRVINEDTVMTQTETWSAARTTPPQAEFSSAPVLGSDAVLSRWLEKDDTAAANWVGQPLAEDGRTQHGMITDSEPTL